MTEKCNLSISTRVGLWANKWGPAILCHLIMFLFMGQRKLAGQMFVEVMRTFGANRKQAAFVFLCEVMVHYLSGPLVGFLGSRFGLRRVILFGCVFSSASIATCALAGNITLLTLCWGLPFGLFSSMAINLLSTLLHFRYKKDKATAIGIALAGPCVGGFIFSPIYKYLLEVYGMSGSFLILGAITLNSVPAAMLLETPKTKMGTLKHRSDKRVNISKGDYFKNNGGSEGNREVIRTHSATADTPAKSTTGSEMQEIDRRFSSVSKNHIGINGHSSAETDPLEENGELQKYEKKCGENFVPIITNIDSSPSVEETRICASSTKNVAKPRTNREPINNVNIGCELPQKRDGTDISVSNQENFVKRDVSRTIVSTPKVHKVWHVLHDPLFLMISFIASAVMSILVVITTVLVDFSLDKGLSLDQGVYTMMCFTIFDMMGRFGLGWVTDGGHVSCEVFVATCFAGTAVCCLVFAYTHFTGGVLSLALAGALIGALLTILPVLTSKYFSRENNAMANASRYILMVPAILALSPMISFFRETLGSYVFLFYCLHGISVVCSVLALLMRTVARRREKK